MVPVIRATVTEQGVLSFESTQRAMLTRWLKTLALSRQPVEVIVRRVKTQRSADQNAYIHAVPVAMIADYTGESVDRTKWFLMGECWGWEQVHGRDFPRKPHTSDMTVEECNHFIDWVLPWAVEHCDGMQIPLPNEVAA